MVQIWCSAVILPDTGSGDWKSSVTNSFTTVYVIRSVIVMTLYISIINCVQVILNHHHHWY